MGGGKVESCVVESQGGPILPLPPPKDNPTYTLTLILLILQALLELKAIVDFSAKVHCLILEVLQLQMKIVHLQLLL